MSSATCRAKSNFQVRTSERSPIFRCPPLRCPPVRASGVSPLQRPKADLYRKGDFLTQNIPFWVRHTPSTAGTCRKKFRKNSGKTPETLSEHFLEFPSRVRLGCPKPYNPRHLRLPEHFQNYLPPPVRLGALLFSEVVPERASQSRSWNSQQYWGYFLSGGLSGTGDSQRDSRESIRANHSQLKPLFL